MKEGWRARERERMREYRVSKGEHRGEMGREIWRERRREKI